jgi:hypothetical protein
MSRSKLGDLDTAALVESYRAAASAHGRATESGDYRTANRNHDVLTDAYRELRARGEDAQRQLLVFLNDVDPHVRTWAATHALEFASELGERVLRLLSTHAGIVGMNAKMTLQEWSRGSLRFP